MEKENNTTQNKYPHHHWWLLMRDEDVLEGDWSHVYWYPTKEEAKEAAKEELHLSPGDSYYVCQAEAVERNLTYYINAEDLMECYEDAAMDESTEEGLINRSRLTDSVADELNEFLDNWADKHGLINEWYEAGEGEKCTYLPPNPKQDE